MDVQKEITKSILRDVQCIDFKSSEAEIISSLDILLLLLQKHNDKEIIENCIEKFYSGIGRLVCCRNFDEADNYHSQLRRILY